MISLLDKVIQDPEITAFERGYVAEAHDNPYGIITTELLDRASGAHDTQQNGVFGWMQDPGKPDAFAKATALQLIGAYGLHSTSDFHDFIEGRTMALIDKMDGVRL